MTQAEAEERAADLLANNSIDVDAAIAELLLLRRAATIPRAAVADALAELRAEVDCAKNRSE